MEERRQRYVVVNLQGYLRLGLLQSFFFFVPALLRICVHKECMTQITRCSGLLLLEYRSTVRPVLFHKAIGSLL